MPGMLMGNFTVLQPSEFKKILGDLGLKMYSGHVDFGYASLGCFKKGFYRYLEKNCGRCRIYGTEICTHS